MQGKKFVVDDMSLKRLLAQAVNAGWMARDLRAEEPDRLPTPAPVIELCVDTVLNCEIERGRIAASRKPLIFTPKGGVFSQEH